MSYSIEQFAALIKDRLPQAQEVEVKPDHRPDRVQVSLKIGPLYHVAITHKTELSDRGLGWVVAEVLHRDRVHGVLRAGDLRLGWPVDGSPIVYLNRTTDIVGLADGRTVHAGSIRAVDGELVTRKPDAAA